MNRKFKYQVLLKKNKEKQRINKKIREKSKNRQVFEKQKTN